MTLQQHTKGVECFAGEGDGTVIVHQPVFALLQPKGTELKYGARFCVHSTQKNSRKNSAPPKDEKSVNER